MCVKLLIADDEDMIRNGIAKYIKLHTDRYETIYLAKNGQEALDIIYRHKPDIMLLDVQMPHKDGIEVMQEAYRAGVLPCTVLMYWSLLQRATSASNNTLIHLFAKNIR